MAAKKRLSEAETASRVLDAATRQVLQGGLVLDLRMRVEDVIAEAGVARAAVYRRWPSREALAVDVLRHVATVVEPPTVGPEALGNMLRRVARRRHGGDGVQLAGALLGESAALEVELLLGSAEWRTYLLLVAAVDALPDPDTRDVIAGVLAASEARRHDRVTAAYRLLAEALALREARPTGINTLVRTATVLIRGSVAEAWRHDGNDAAAEAVSDVRASLPPLVALHLRTDAQRELPADWAIVLRRQLLELAQ